MLPAAVCDLPAPEPASNSVRLAPPRKPESYAPGPIRAATDVEAASISQFCHRHPEYAKLGSDAIVQAMSTYQTEEAATEQQVLADEGVPVDVLCGFRPADPTNDEE